MADKYTYEYPRPALTADCVIFGFDGNALNVLLIERGVEPYKGYWALPGGFMRMDETIDECARRELMEETQVKDIYIEQFRVFSSTNRDPRGRVVTVAFIALGGSPRASPRSPACAPRGFQSAQRSVHHRRATPRLRGDQ